MSTRSGKRIHISFQENTVKSETDFTRSERKTRSKPAKDFDELNASPKQKKRNYVAYPAHDEAGIDTVDSKEEKRTRVLRKNVLKEQDKNIPSLSTTLEVDTKSVRSTRRTRKLDENSEDAPEVAPQEEEPSKVDLPKQKKTKKKKKAKQEDVIEVKLAVPKKKSKKKKDRRSGSLIVEDIVQETPSALNKSNMSVDSFHSAAGSPRNLDNCDELVGLPQDLEAVNTNSKNDTRRTKSSIKLDSNLMKENVMKIEPKRKSSVKVSLDSNLKDDTEKEKADKDNSPNREFRKRKSSFRDVPVSQHKGDQISTFGTEKLITSTRKSLRNATIDKIATPTKINTTFEKEEMKVSSSQKKKRETIENEMLDVNKDLKSTAEENAVILSFERDFSTESGRKSKKRIESAVALIKAFDETIENDWEEEDINKKSIVDDAFHSTEYISRFYVKSSPKSAIKLCLEQTKMKPLNTTIENDSDADSDSVNGKKKSIVNETFDLISSPFKSANEASSPFLLINDFKCKSVINTTYEKDSDIDQDISNIKSINTTFDKSNTETKINTTFDKDKEKTADIKNKGSLLQRLSTQKITNTEINSTFDVDQEKKLNTTFDKNSESSSSIISSDSSMITLDKSNDSRISITSDESKTKENIMNTTPVLIESSMDESIMNTTKTATKGITPLKAEPVPPVTPLKREGTFTKDKPEVIDSPKPKVSLSRTPTKQTSLSSPGFTPFYVNKSPMKEKSVLLNVTRSIEKRRSSLAEPPRTTKVMFCSPVNDPTLVTQNRKKVIKSNLKGSNKSFVFDESGFYDKPDPEQVFADHANISPAAGIHPVLLASQLANCLPRYQVSLEARLPSRKRSYTQSDAEEARGKRSRLAVGMQLSVDRLSRPRTSSASAKLAEPTTPSKKATTPSKKSEAKLPRTKLPNFAAMHQKQFAKMESLDECQERRAKRAKQLLTPTGAVNVLERISPKEFPREREDPSDSRDLKQAKSRVDKSAESEKAKEPPTKPETPIKSLPTFKSLNPGYTRFGFKLNLDVNPFSIPSKAQPKPKESKPNGLNRQATLPSLAGATSVRREVAKQTVMREKSFTDRRNVTRTENRTVIKGVRTNRRFELQMRMRDI